MNENIFIHLGLPRTGTSFLQKNVFPNMDINLIVNNYLNFRIDKDKINLISDEDLFFDMHDPLKYSNPIESLKRIFCLFPKGKIIVTIRDKKEWLDSVYSCYLMHGGCLDFEHYLIYNTIFRDFNVVEYVNEIKCFFDDYLILDYDELVNNSESYIKKICTFINVPTPNYKNQIINKGINKVKRPLYRTKNKLLNLKI